MEKKKRQRRIKRKVYSDRNLNRREIKKSTGNNTNDDIKICWARLPEATSQSSRCTRLLRMSLLILRTRYYPSHSTSEHQNSLNHQGLRSNRLNNYAASCTESAVEPREKKKSWLVSIRWVLSIVLLQVWVFLMCEVTVLDVDQHRGNDGTWDLGKVEAGSGLPRHLDCPLGMVVPTWTSSCKGWSPESSGVSHERARGVVDGRGNAVLSGLNGIVDVAVTGWLCQGTRLQLPKHCTEYCLL